MYMSVGTAEELFVDELKDVYSAEKQAVKAYPRLTKAVQSGDLRFYRMVSNLSQR
jgi:ferritin-like metal-binding protein YciE